MASPEKPTFLITGQAQGQHPACRCADEKHLTGSGNSLGDEFGDQIMDKSQVAVRIRARRIRPTAQERFRIGKDRTR